MEFEKKKSGLGWMVFLIIFSAMVLYSLGVTLKLAAGEWKALLWMAGGMAAYFVINRYLFATPDILKTAEHELDHAVVCCLFFKRVTEFNVRERSGEIYHVKGGSISSAFISLAPYCLPLFSYILLMVRSCIVGEMVWLFDVLIGIVTAFHMHCFHEDTSSGQSDISQYRNLLFPYWFIYAFRVFNLVVIVRSMLGGMNVFKAFYGVVGDYVAFVKLIWVCVF